MYEANLYCQARKGNSNNELSLWSPHLQPNPSSSERSSMAGGQAGGRSSPTVVPLALPPLPPTSQTLGEEWHGYHLLCLLVFLLVLSSLHCSCYPIRGFLHFFPPWLELTWFFHYWTFFIFLTVLQTNLASWHIQLPHWNWKLNFSFFSPDHFPFWSFLLAKARKKRRVKKCIFLINLCFFCLSILLLNVAGVGDKTPIANYLHVIYFLKVDENVKAEKI